ncbi:MAG: hypothetical protein P3X22_006755 [Thermoprotei archaeon]|nr:hypothetical protein [Thermoprotei archaeon]
MLRTSQYITVIVENNRVTVAGRVYESGHALLIGADRLNAHISYDRIRVEAYFPLDSQVEPHVEGVVKVVAPGERYEVDTLGSRISEVSLREGFIVKGQVVSIKFEGDEEGGDIIVKIPKVKKLRAKKLELRSGRKTSMNIMTVPFTIGIITAQNVAFSIKLVDDTILIEAE